MMNEVQIMKMYDDGQSIHRIAEEVGTYPNKIRRLLKKNGKTLRTKSEAQKTALANGTSKHPTAGKQRSEETKVKISESVDKVWKSMPDKERARRADLAREQWDNMTQEQKDELKKAAGEAMRQASKEGSKMEKFLRDELTKLGYHVIFHKKGLIVREEMEVDLYIPDLHVAIEIDGPSHFFPIWGYENLQKHIKADARKSGLLLGIGATVIRVKHMAKTVSKKHERETLQGVLEVLEKVKETPLPKDKRFVELEII